MPATTVPHRNPAHCSQESNKIDATATGSSRSEPAADAPQARQRKMMLDDEFYCRPRRRRLSLEKCLEDYMNANAFATKRAACWRCPQGCNIRRQFADDGI